jgi:hypothetical protein
VDNDRFAASTRITGQPCMTSLNNCSRPKCSNNSQNEAPILRVVSRQHGTRRGTGTTAPCATVAADRSQSRGGPAAQRPISGQVDVKPTTLDGAICYELHYTALSGGTLSSVVLPGPKTATISNLIPGTTYQFQVRAVGQLGYADWSDAVNFICT